MKLPNNIDLSSAKSSIKEIDDNHVVLSVDETDTTEMYDIDYPDESESIKYTKHLVRLIRSSYEYKQFIGILKNEMNLTKCRFIPLVDIENTKGLSIEMHHYPYTLFDIVHAVRDKLIVENKINESYHTFEIIKRVMEMHYEGKVGIVPLSYTAHELSHSGELFIPLTEEFVFGNWKDIDDDMYLSEGLREKLNILEKYTERIKEDPELFDLSILDPISTQIEMKEAIQPVKIEDEELKQA